MLAWWHRAGGCCGGFVLGFTGQAAHVGSACKGRVGQAGHAGVGINQFLLSGVPGFQHFVVWQAADQAGVDQARIAHAWHVTALGEHAMDVPDGLLGQWEVFGQEAAAVLLAEEAVEAPQAVLLGTDVQQVHHQQVTRFSTFDTNGAAEVVHRAQVDVTNIVSTVVVFDEATGPVEGLQDELIAWVDPARHGDVRVPAIVDVFVEGGRLGQIDFDQGVSHGVPRCVK